MFTFLNKSYPCSFRWKEIVWRAIVFGGFVTLFLYFFQPFGLSILPQSTLVTAASGFGLITLSAIILTNGLMTRAFPSLFLEDKWTVWKEITMLTLTMTAIAVGNSIYLIMMKWTNDSLSDVFLTMEVNVVGLGLIPIVFYVYYDQNKLLKQHLAGADSLTHKIQQHTSPSKKQTAIVLNDENGRNELTIDMNQLIYIASDRNYLDVFWCSSDRLHKQIVRNRLSTIVNELPHDLFFRCHRGYVINLDWVECVKGNARGYELHLKKATSIVPVSRNNIPEMERRLEHLLQ